MTDQPKKTAPCKVCGKQIPLPPWPIIEDSLQCLDHVQMSPVEKVMIDVLQGKKPSSS